MSIQLVVFDLDGTLIRGSTCCELIAGRIGHLDRMRQFERCATKDEITAARVEMAGWYSRYTEEELTAPLIGAVAAPGLRVGFERLSRAGAYIAIASITWSFAVRWFAERLAAQFHLGTELRKDGSIDHVRAEDKACWLEQLTAKLGFVRADIAAVGDSAGDWPMLLAAGRSYYLGNDCPPSPKITHSPAGDIDEIAQELLADARGVR